MGRGAGLHASSGGAWRKTKARARYLAFVLQGEILLPSLRLRGRSCTLPWRALAAVFLLPGGSGRARLKRSSSIQFLPHPLRQISAGAGRRDGAPTHSSEELGQGRTPFGEGNQSHHSQKVPLYPGKVQVRRPLAMSSTPCAGYSRSAPHLLRPRQLPWGLFARGSAPRSPAFATRPEMGRSWGRKAAAPIPSPR